MTIDKISPDNVDISCCLAPEMRFEMRRAGEEEEEGRGRQAGKEAVNE